MGENTKTEQQFLSPNPVVILLTIAYNNVSLLTSCHVSNDVFYLLCSVWDWSIEIRPGPGLGPCLDCGLDQSGPSVSPTLRPSHYGS